MVVLIVGISYTKVCIWKENICAMAETTELAETVHYCNVSSPKAQTI